MSVYQQTYREWAGRARLGKSIARVSRVVQHHEAGAAVSERWTVSQEVQRCRAIDNYHRSLGWGGVGYNAITFPSGRVYEGRGYGRSGAHTRGMNTTAHGHCAAGNGNNRSLTEKEIAKTREWIGEGIRIGAIASNPTVSAHRDHVSTQCPGSRIYPQLHRLRGVTGPVVAIVYRRYSSAPLAMRTKIDATLWKFDYPTWSQMHPAPGTEEKQYKRGHRVDLVGYAEHPTGSRYGMTAFSFGNADKTDVPTHPQGFNVEDLEPVPAPIPPPPPPVGPRDPSTKSPEHTEAWEWSWRNGLLNGRNPDGPISRDDLALVLWRYDRI